MNSSQSKKCLGSWPSGSPPKKPNQQPHGRAWLPGLNKGGVMFYDKLSKTELINLLKEKLTASNPNKIVDYFRNEVRDWSVENFCYLVLDNNLNIIKSIKHRGSVNSCAIWYAQDWKKIIGIKKAARIAICHNHPAGSLKFSPEDLKVKTRILEIAKLFDFSVIDFLVITETGYLSAAETGNLEN